MGGSFARGGRYREIVIDGRYRDNPELTAGILSHEVGHAVYQVPVDSSSREAFINSYLADEGAATLSNIRFSREVAQASDGSISVPVLGSSANIPVYNAVYDHYLSRGDAAFAHKAIGSIYRNGETTSIDGQTYSEYYGAIYDSWKKGTE